MANMRDHIEREIAHLILESSFPPKKHFSGTSKLYLFFKMIKKQPHSDFAAGNVALRARDYDRAIDHYQKALKNERPELSKIIKKSIEIALLKKKNDKIIAISNNHTKNSSTKGGKIAILMHITCEKSLETLFRYISNIPTAYDLFISIPKNKIEDLTHRINKHTTRWTLHATDSHIDQNQAFLKLLDLIRAEDYGVFYKVHTEKDNGDDRNLIREECQLDATLGDTHLVSTIIDSFSYDPTLVTVGPALLFESMASSTYVEKSSIEAVANRIMPKHRFSDWGFFSGSVFWGCTSYYKKLINKLTSENVKDSLGKGKWEYILERLFGLANHINSGKFGVVDYSLKSAAFEKTLRIFKSDDKFAIPASTNTRIKLYERIRKRTVNKHLLISSAGILDPYYYYIKNHLPSKETTDCIDHFLTKNNSNFLSQKHEDGEVSISLNDREITAIENGQKTNYFINKNFASETLAPYLIPEKPSCNDQGIKVSVICITYNHEKFIRDALEGFLIQKANFKFEIIIGDDASTDCTANIIQEYADKHPDLFVFVRRKKNVGIHANILDLMKRVRGQYVAMNEGDDFWLASTKLQSQVDYMESHPECAICFHPVRVVYENNRKIKEIFPSNLSGFKFSLDSLVEDNFIQTNSVLYRWAFHKTEIFPEDISFLPLDWYCHLMHARYGEIHMLNEVMSVYRKHDGGIWAGQASRSSLLKKWGVQHIDMYRQSNKALNNEYHAQNIQRMVAIFTDLAREYIAENNIEDLYKLIDNNKDIYNIGLSELGWKYISTMPRDKHELVSALSDQYKVTTIITCYNQASYIEECIKSVISQSGLFTHEIIIADDCSTDATGRIVAEYNKRHPKLIKVLPTPKNLGMLGNMKRAFAAATGDFIAICEGDDYWLSERKLHKQLTFLLERPDTLMCFNWLLLLNDSSKVAVPHTEQGTISKDHVTFEELIATNLPGNFSCCFYRNTALSKVPENYFNGTGAADWLFNLYIAESNPIGFVRDILSVYRINENGQWSRLSFSQQRAVLQNSYKKFIGYFPKKASYISDFIDVHSELDDIQSTHKEECNSVRAWVDSIECSYNYFSIRGWLVHLDHHTQQHENKAMLLLDRDGQVVTSQEMENTHRSDLSGALSSYFTISKPATEWGGFKTVFSDSIPEGTYQLALGRVLDRKLLFARTSIFVTYKEERFLELSHAEAA